MVQFCEIKIQQKDNKKYFGFTDPKGIFIKIGSSHGFDSVKSLREDYDPKCRFSIETLLSKIPEYWYDYEEDMDTNLDLKNNNKN